MLTFTDSHTHIDLLHVNPSIMINNALDHGVTRMLSVSTSIGNFLEVLAIAWQHQEVFISLGIHPCSVTKQPIMSAQQLIALADNKKVIALGETGLDYFHQGYNQELQIQSFIAHIKAAQITKLPLIIHTRDAEEDTLRILQKEMEVAPFAAVIHCFTGSIEFAKACLELGFYISFSGIVTFPKATELQEVAKYVPLSHLLIETDAPYLTPVPKRGKENQPAYVKYVAEYLAQLKNVDVKDISLHTNENFNRLFSIC